MIQHLGKDYFDNDARGLITKRKHQKMPFLQSTGTDKENNNLLVRGEYRQALIQDEHAVCQAIRETARKFASDSSHDFPEIPQNTCITALKQIAAYYTLFSIIASCAYPFVLFYHATFMFAEQSYINEKDSNVTPYLADTLATIFMLCDMGNTYYARKNSVINMLTTPNWSDGISKAWSRLTTCDMPLPLTICGSLTTIASGVKSAVGVNFLLDHLFKMLHVKHQSADIITNTLSALIGIGSGLSFYAFQINNKGMEVVNKRRALNELEAWDRYKREHAGMYYSQNIAGFFIAMTFSFVNAISLFFAKGNFEIELLPAIYFIVISIANTICNLIYTSNFNYIYWLAENAHYTNGNCIECLENHPRAPHEASNWQKVIGAVNALGTGITFYPALAQVILKLAGKQSLSESTPISIISVALTALMTFLIIPRVYTMTVRGAYKFDGDPASPTSQPNQSPPRAAADTGYTAINMPRSTPFDTQDVTRGASNSSTGHRRSTGTAPSGDPYGTGIPSQGLGDIRRQPSASPSETTNDTYVVRPGTAPQ